MPNLNPNSILFLYEGATEIEFYNKIFQEYLPPRSIRIKKKNLYGVSNITKKVASRIEWYLNENPNLFQIHVFVAYDREGPRTEDPMLNIELLETNFVSQGSRIISINEIVATRDLESWLFKDIDGIYGFLRVPISRRNPRKYYNTEATDNRMLSKLFREYKKSYLKGKRVEGFLNALNILKIYNNTPELQRAINLMGDLCDSS
jgi:hypothetical protein